MSPTILIALTAVLAALACGGALFAFTGADGTSKKRIASVARTSGPAGKDGRAVDTTQQRRKAVQALLKDLEKQQAEQKQRPTIRRRIEQAGLKISPRTFWMMSATAGLAAVALCLIFRQSYIVSLLAG